MPQRIYGLELLRGLCALLVAVYHCTLWGGIAELTSFGLYGVYVFFAISGAVLYHNYHDRLSIDGARGLSVAGFLGRRFARLLPLYALCAMILAVAGSWTPWRDVLNVSMLFGLANPGQTSTVVGGWSLGIEIVFYALFPVLLGLMRDTRMMLLTFAALLLLRVAFVEMLIRGSSLEAEWDNYTQPGTFLVFFFGGMVAAALPLGIAKAIKYIMGAVLLVVLFSFQVEADVLLLGVTGLTYTLLTIALVWFFSWSPTSEVANRVCAFFGDVSYGLYLFHPLAWEVFERTPLGVIERCVLTIVAATALAWITLRVYERPAQRILRNFVLPRTARLVGS